MLVNDDIAFGENVQNVKCALVIKLNGIHGRKSDGRQRRGGYAWRITSARRPFYIAYFIIGHLNLLYLKKKYF